MSKDIQFVTDAEGNRTGAIVPIEEYEEWVASHEEVAKETHLNSQQSDLMERKDLIPILQSALNAGVDLTDGSPTGVETDAN